jgi:general secretion pathway protein K
MQLKTMFLKTRNRCNKRSIVGRDERGMALLITIMTLSLLTAVTIQFHKSTWHKFVVSDNFKRGVQLKAITQSGINIALASLANDLEENDSDTLVDPWSKLEQENLDLLFPAGGLQLKVIDLSGRLQINNIIEKEKTDSKEENSGISTHLRTILENLLVSGNYPIEDETEATEIVDALVDWIDEDDNESDHGAETSYYQSLEKPYSAKNGPVHHIDELLLVRGITPELFFGTEDTPGLKNVLTVYGDDGKININTIEPALLKGMNLLITDDLAKDFDEYRREDGNSDSFNDSGWYKDIGWPGDIELNTELLTTESSYFQVTASGTFDTLSWTMVADVERTDEGTLNLLRKKME